MVEFAFIISAEAQLDVQREYAPNLFTENIRTHFGVSTTVCIKLWFYIKEHLKVNTLPKHVLWYRYFLLVYLR